MSTGKRDLQTRKMMMLTLTAVCGLVAVILAAFYILSPGKTQGSETEATDVLSASISASRQEKRVEEEAAASTGGIYEDTGSGEEADDRESGTVLLIKGNPASPNSYERINRLSYTKTVRYMQKDIEALDAEGLKITRAEILGRHGRIFNDQNLQDYFEGQSWYTPQYTAREFDVSCLNDVERYNLEFLLAAEQSLQN